MKATFKLSLKYFHALFNFRIIQMEKNNFNKVLVKSNITVYWGDCPTFFCGAQKEKLKKCAGHFFVNSCNK